MVIAAKPHNVDALYTTAEHDFERWEVLKDLVDELIDLALNYRQSGHPGGSRSKVHMLLALLFSGAMRWDLQRPWRPFMDRFVLSRRPHRAAHLRDAVGPQRGPSCAPRPRRRRSVRAGRRWPMGGHLGGPAQAAPPRRAARPCRDGGQDPLPEVQHRTERPRHAARRGRGARAQACRRGRGQGLRVRGRGRPDAGRQPRNAEHRVGPRPQQPRLHGRLERLRHR